ncbi:unnamed protein product [Echinostoma caproni]|uniref:Uncharacterized protein n=1 Tax=Echinostoma caproni TaxID=27848 RepID=A0A183AKD4_9TREM|nr:unnamed protein product [Echinostoma caproni]
MEEKTVMNVPIVLQIPLRTLLQGIPKNPKPKGYGIILRWKDS